jgi:hypothetical protein
MSPSQEIALTSNDVDEMIHRFESKYGFSSADFFSDPEVKQQLPEDDIFQWEMLIHHRLALREQSLEIRSAYIQQVGRSTEEVARSEKENQYALAA